MALSKEQTAGVLARLRERLDLLEVEISRKLGDSAEELATFDRVGDTGDLQSFQIDMFMQQARQFGITPLIHARLENGTPEKAAALVRITEESLALAIEQARVGNRLSDISHAVQRHVEAAGYSVVTEFVGHGIGRQLHEEPQVPNYGKPGQGPRLQAGMVLAIEPMVNMGGSAVRVLDDRWTAVTADGSASAHFEHTVLVTEGDPEVLTRIAGSH